jgi:hypothetical protein
LVVLFVAEFSLSRGFHGWNAQNKPPVSENELLFRFRFSFFCSLRYNNAMMSGSKASDPMIPSDFCVFHTPVIRKTFEICSFSCGKQLLSHKRNGGTAP